MKLLLIGLEGLDCVRWREHRKHMPTLDSFETQCSISTCQNPWLAALSGGPTWSKAFWSKKKLKIGLVQVPTEGQADLHLPKGSWAIGTEDMPGQWPAQLLGYNGFPQKGLMTDLLVAGEREAARLLEETDADVLVANFRSLDHVGHALYLNRVAMQTVYQAADVLVDQLISTLKPERTIVLAPYGMMPISACRPADFPSEEKSRGMMDGWDGGHRAVGMYFDSELDADIEHIRQVKDNILNRGPLVQDSRKRGKRGVAVHT